MGHPALSPRAPARDTDEGLHADEPASADVAVMETNDQDMMQTRPHHPRRRLGLSCAALLLGTVACTGPSPTPGPPTPAATVAPSGVPSDEPSAAPTASVPVASDPGTAVTTTRPGPTPIVGEARPAPEFVDLVRADGTPFHLADQRGHRTLVFFGYTHCPDVCPASLGELIGVLQERPDVRVVFVTVDPERDTPEFLAEWTKYLPSGLVGVTGSPSAIRYAADLYGARYARVDTVSAAGYSMSHTAFQYLIDEEGTLLMTYPFGTPAAAIVGDLDALDRAG
jgi:protein SCO1/2